MQSEAQHSIDIIIGSQLRLRRKMLGLSQSALARRMGITFQQVQKYECGRNSISARRLFEVAQLLQVSPMYFYASCESGECPPADAFSTQAIHLVQDYNSIASVKVRNSLAALVREMAKEQRSGL
jgi:transcriptional regulator with XRE-family HTH domain